MKKKIALVAISLLLSMHTTILKANFVSPLTIFNNEGYSDNPNLNLYVEVVPLGPMIDFEFHNESLIDSCIAEIYFDDNSMLSPEGIYADLSMSFSMLATPHNLPAAQELDTPFEADFSVNADPAGPHNGINPTESLTLRCNLINNATAGNVTDALSSGLLRIGVHVIGLPDGSSGSAVTPEPATILLLGFGVVMLKRKC